MDSPKSRFSFVSQINWPQDILSKKTGVILSRVGAGQLQLKGPEAIVKSQDFWQRYGLAEDVSVEQEAKVDELVELGRRCCIKAD